MKKSVLAATGLSFALALAACGETSTDEAALDGTAMEADAAVDAGAEVSMDGTGTMTDGTGTMTGDAMTTDQQAEVLDESAENLEERADRVEDTNEAEADRLEAQAEAQQDSRDVID